MSARPGTPTPAQARAADPRHSVWVTANAGTGKTRVLSDRVLRLLLAGANPEGILCITFTKAAAVEMTERIERDLAEWAIEPNDKVLDARIEATTGTRPDDRQRARARRLFSQVLDLPRGLGIMTIHAFCTSVLRRFPLEAGIAPHFETIDERGAAELMREARANILARAAFPGEPLSAALELLATTMAETSLNELLVEILAKRTRLQAALARHGGDVERLIAEIARALEADPTLKPADIVAGACRDGEYDAERLTHAADVLAASEKTTDQERGHRIARWLNLAEADRIRLFDDYKAAFLTKEDQGQARLATKAVAEAHPEAADALLTEQVRLLRLIDRLRAATLFRRSAALLRVAAATIEAYEAEKKQQAGLDYDDLIERTRRLLAEPGRRQWVLFKLDARLEHILVDEAQDTSPAQWAIVEHLVEEFFAGEGAHDANRTLFVVGDEKQSIYSFQGADLENFRAVRDRLEARAEAAGRPILRETLDLSFRSTRPILEVVENLLRQPELTPGVVEPEAPVTHDTVRRNDPGRIELWPLMPPPAEAEMPEPWSLPNERRVARSSEERLAALIARRIEGWLAEGFVLPSTGLPVRPADILVLVSRRGLIQELLIRALKRRRVAVAGADRIRLAEHIAVMDLIALGRAVLLPEDDLNLACLLKSPLVGLDEEALFELAWQREEKGLFERLREKATAEPERFGEAHRRIETWRRQADFMPPYEFYAGLLGAGGGRARLLGRLGAEAQEPIEAFLEQALAYEEGHPASLEGFLHWLGADEGSLKRDPESARDEVRVMTVHGAKGLEAPIVILADAGPHHPASNDRIVFAGDDGALPLWRPAKAEREGLTHQHIERLEVQRREERLRLLYVALTRAQDRLCVTGWAGRREARDEEPSWHDLVGRAIGSIAGVEDYPFPLPDGETGRMRLLERGGAATPAPQSTGPSADAAALPEWAVRPAPVERALEPPLRPSFEENEEPAAASPAGAAAERAKRFGVEVHRLLHRLAEAAPEARPTLLDRYLAPGDESPEDAAELRRQVLGVLELPELAPAFGPGSRGEQPIIGRLGDRVISGQIDRLAVTDDAVYLVDFKTNRHPPAGLDGIPRLYLRQLAAYAGLLQAIHPGRVIRAGIVWTAVPRLMPLPFALLRPHLAGGGAPGGSDQPA